MRKLYLMFYMFFLLSILGLAPVAAADGNRYSFDDFDLSDTPDSIIKKVVERRMEVLFITDNQEIRDLILEAGFETTDKPRVRKIEHLPPFRGFLGAAARKILGKYQDTLIRAVRDDSFKSYLSSKPALVDMAEDLYMLEVCGSSLKIGTFFYSLKFLFYQEPAGDLKLLYITGRGGESMRTIRETWTRKYGRGQLEEEKKWNGYTRAESWENDREVIVVYGDEGLPATAFYMYDKASLKDWADRFAEVVESGDQGQAAEERI